MKVAIIGSRGYNNYEKFCEIISDLKLDITSVISGGAIGVDTLADRWCKDNNILIKVIRPNYKDKSVNPKIAPLLRNKIIINECDYYIAFWDMISGGTGFTISYAEEIGKKGKIINIIKL